MINKLLNSDDEWQFFCDRMIGSLRGVRGKEKRLRLLLALNHLTPEERACFGLRGANTQTTSGYGTPPAIARLHQRAN